MALVALDQEQQQAHTKVALTSRDRADHVEQKPRLSIYDTYTKFEKITILIIVSYGGFLSELTETIYITALPAMVNDLQTTEATGLLTISTYFFAISFSGLIWGVLSDYFGRKPIVLIALCGFILSVIGCYFSWNIYIVILFRTLQGCFISVTVVVGPATLTDIYMINKRGTALGIFYGIYFSGAILGPIVGGQLSEHFGWRSTFLFVGIISCLLFTAYILFVRETHQYKVARKYQLEENIMLIESDEISKPILINPCLPLLYLKDLTMLPYVLVVVTSYAALNIGFIDFSTELSKKPYSYHEDIIGLIYIPMCIVLLVGSITGGKLSDLAAIKCFQTSKIIEGRIVPGLILSVLTPVGLIVYGWCAQFGAPVAYLIIGQVLFGFGQTATRPGIYSFYTVLYQQNSAAVTSANNSVQQLLTAILLSFTTKVTLSIGSGPYFTILALINVLTMIVAAVIIYGKVRQSVNSEQHSLLSAMDNNHSQN